MRVMVIVKATKDSEARVMPTRQLLEDMGRFNQELINAGVMLDGAGLKASSHGARVRFPSKEAAAPKRTVIDGPFAETKELIAGYWLWQVKDLAEAVEWVRRCPHPHPGADAEIEIRPLFEMSDFEQ